MKDRIGIEYKTIDEMSDIELEEGYRMYIYILGKHMTDEYGEKTHREFCVHQLADIIKEQRKRKLIKLKN